MWIAEPNRRDTRVAETHVYGHLLFPGRCRISTCGHGLLYQGKQSDRSVEVDVAALRVALLCLSASDDSAARDEKMKRHGINTQWMKWYVKCQEKATLKRDAMYSWARTLALCSVLCIMGVCLEAEFDEPITVSRILAGFRLPRPITIEAPLIPSSSVKEEVHK